MAIDSTTNFARSYVTSGAMSDVSPANGGTFTVNDGSNFPSANFYVVIDTEIILISSRSTNTFTVDASNGRAQKGTAAAAHAANSAVTNGPLSHHVQDAAYINQTNAFSKYQHIDVATAPSGAPTSGGAYLWGTNLGGSGVLEILTQVKTNAGNGFHMVNASTSTSSLNTGAFIEYNVTPGADSSGTYWNVIDAKSLGTANFTGDVMALFAVARHYSSGTTAKAYGLYGQVTKQLASGAMTTAKAVTAAVTSAAGTITTAHGFYAVEPAVSGTGAVTNAYGLFVEPIDVAGTLNVGARIDTATTAALWLGGDTTGTTVSGGIAFGSGRDTTLYRGGSALLTTSVDFSARDIRVNQASSLGSGVGVLAIGQATTSVSVRPTTGTLIWGAPSGYSSATPTLQIWPEKRTVGGTNVYLDLVTESTGSLNAGFYTIYKINPQSASSTDYYNLFLSGTESTAVGNFTGEILGVIGDSRHGASGTLDRLTAVYGKVSKGSTSGAITTMRAVLAFGDNAGGTATTYTGFYSKHPTKSGSGAYTTVYGVYVEPMTNGGTNIGVGIGTATQASLVVGIDTDGTAAAGGIFWGSSRDTNLYRSAANSLKTDDNFYSLSVNALAGTFAQSADAVALVARGHSSQTNNILSVENNGGTRQYLSITGEKAAVNTGAANVYAAWSSLTASGFSLGHGFNYDLVPASASSSSHYNYVFTTVANTVAQNFTGDLGAWISQMNYHGTGTHNATMFASKSAIVTSGSHGAITTAWSSLVTGDFAGAITTWVGTKTALAGAGTITNAYGMWIDPITLGGTLSVGARIDTPSGAGTKVGLWLGANSTDTTTAGGIAFGSGRDVNLYRSAADTLKTDDAFIANTVTDGSVLVTKQVPLTFSKSGTLSVTTGTHRQYIDGGNWTISSIRASVGTAPTGASLIVDVNKNGTTVHTTQSNRATIAASGFTDLADSIQVNTLTTGDYLTVDIDQVGSTVAGSDLTVTIWLQRAA